MKIIEAIVVLLICAAIALAFACLGGWIFMVCWNFVLPVFGVTTLTFPQSLALVVLLSLIGSLFKSRYSKD